MGYKTVLKNMTCFLLTTGTGVAEIDTGLNVIKTIGIGVCSVIGILGLIKGGIDFASGLSQRDQSGIVTGGLELGGGLVMAAIGVVIGVLGF